MADSKMADSKTNDAYNVEESPNAEMTNTTSAASGIASDDHDHDHTYANIPAPAPATANDAPSETAPSSSSSTDNADGGASASEEPKPKVTNNTDFSFMLNLPLDEFLRVTMIMSLFRPLLPSTFDENDLLHKVLTIIEDSRTTHASSPPPPSMSVTPST